MFVCATVLLESEWVLRSVYGYAPARLATALAAFAGLGRVKLEDAALIAKALDLRWMRRSASPSRESYGIPDLLPILGPCGWSQ